MSRKLIGFHPEAEREYLAALAWYSRRSSVAGINFEAAIAGAAARIEEAPRRWPSYGDEFRK